MLKRFSAFFEFNRKFLHYTIMIRDAIVILLLLMVLGGWAIAKLEGMTFGDALYFSFITGLSIGYGDITPKTGLGRVVSVGIGLIGMLFVGMSVAVSTRALRDTVERAKKHN